MLWESYDAQRYNGRRYGQKAASFTPYLDLPRRTGRIFELAVGSSAAPGPMLEGHGWDVIDPREPTRDPWAYQRYIQASKAEFGVAKHGYVMSRSGWFSERSAAYLASGRPVVVQDTGFSDWMPTGDGVLRFDTLDEAMSGVHAVNERYEAHCRAAREVAESFFDARVVLARLIEEAMSTASAGSRVPDADSSVAPLRSAG